VLRPLLDAADVLADREGRRGGVDGVDDQLVLTTANGPRDHGRQFLALAVVDLLLIEDVGVLGGVPVLERGRRAGVSDVHRHDVGLADTGGSRTLAHLGEAVGAADDAVAVANGRTQHAHALVGMFDFAVELGDGSISELLGHMTVSCR
jgi:hypothetical protein